jgi:hypothetical protein
MDVVALHEVCVVHKLHVVKHALWQLVVGRAHGLQIRNSSHAGKGALQAKVPQANVAHTAELQQPWHAWKKAASRWTNSALFGGWSWKGNMLACRGTTGRVPVHAPACPARALKQYCTQQCLLFSLKSMHFAADLQAADS